MYDIEEWNFISRLVNCTKFSVIAVAPRPDVVVVGDAERLRVARAARHVDHAVRR